MRTKAATIVCLTVMVAILVLASLPPVTGDGCPTISYGKYEEDPEGAFSSIFESRQLAQVELKDATHQRISLFLSVYSLDPGTNLTILVPLRTIPDSVSGEPIREDQFRENFSIAKAEKEIIRQDPDRADKNLEKGVKEKMQMIGGSMIWSYPAEYTRQNVRRQSSSGGYKGDEDATGGSSGEYGKDEPQPIQKFEFDGFSIEVYSVTSGPTLKEHLENKGLVLPNSTVFSAYYDDYVAIIESGAKSPIDDKKFLYIKEYCPDTLDYVIERNRDNPNLEGWARDELMWEIEDKIEQEYEETVFEKEMENISYSPEVSSSDIRRAMGDLVDAIFGETNYDGEVVYMDLPLDNGKMYFPLGTSGGWPNAVGEIDIIFKVPENKGLTIQDSKDVFFNGHHWYLFHMENANPAFDLESRVSAVEDGRQDELERAAFINDNYEVLGLIINSVAVMVIYFALAVGLKVVRRKKEKVFTNPGIWICLGLSLFISVPGALLVYFVFKPMPLKEIKNNLVPVVLLVLYPISIAFFIMGVMI